MQVLIRRSIVTLVFLFFPLGSYAQYSNLASYVGQGGAASTSGTYSSFSSIRQDVNTGISHGSNITHYSGFISAFISKDALDTDGDGLLDENDPDNDNDGINDEDELSGSAFTPNVVTSVNDPDSDDDGVNDGAESIAGTDPTINTSFFAVTNLTEVGAGATNFVITVPTVNGRQYDIFFAGALSTTGSTWTTFTTNGTWLETNIAGGTHGFVDDFTSSSSGSSPSNGVRFYRVNVSKP